MNIVEQVSKQPIEMITKPINPNSWNIAKYIGIKKGATAVIASTVGLELITQLIERANATPTSVLKFLDYQILPNWTSKIPTGSDKIDNAIDVRDLITLMPALTNLVMAVKDKSPQAKSSRIKDSVAGVATKGIMRLFGINPHLLSKGTTAPQNPRVFVGVKSASNKGVYA
jgi:hypothetical protein